MIATERYTAPRHLFPALRRGACLGLAALSVAVPAAADASSKAATPADASGHRVFFRSFLQGSYLSPQYRPKVIQFGERSGIVQIRWSRWDSRVARGRGTVLLNSCQPNCADSRPLRYAVRIKLSRARHCNTGGRYDFTRFAFRYVYGPPPGHRSRYAEIHPC